MQSKTAKELIGCCGLYCGLCPKYQSQTASRCNGCKLGEQHSWCSIWNCCVKKKGFETCAECGEIFTCEIFLRRKVSEWIPASDNLNQIKETGLVKWLKEQKERQSVLEEMLCNFNEGRSRSFLCKACARMPVNLIADAIKEANKKILSEGINKSDIKIKAKIMKSIIRDKAVKHRINID